MKKKVSIGVILASALLMFQMVPMSIGTTEPWNVTTPLPNASRSHHAAVHDNRIYVVGGWGPNNSIYNRVLYASVQPDGHIEDPPGWQNTTASLPPDENGHSGRAKAPVIVYDDWIYVLGGVTDYWHMERYNVWFARINPNGDITDWNETTRLPYRNPETAVLWNGRIYILAGWDGYNEHNDVWYATINQTTGELSSWNKTTSLPRQIAHSHAAAIYNGVIYFIGGEEAYPTYHAREVYYAIINETTGEVGNWTETAPLPVPLGNHDAMAYGDDLFVIGGNIGGTSNVSDIIYKAHINADGSLASWEVDQHLPEPLGDLASVILNGRLYVIGGARQDGTIVDTVYFKELLPRKSTQVFFNINPNLTTSGQTINLMGVLVDETATPVVGLPNESVQLYARPLRAPSGWVYIASLTTDTKGIFTWQVTIPWTTTPDTYIIVVYYPGSATYESSYNFDLLMIQ